jgi:hypothetical protein
MSQGWETLVTNIYGHDREAHVLQEVETHLPKKTGTQMPTKVDPK